MQTKLELDEIWKDIAGYGGYYQISNLGRVKRVGKNTYIRASVKTNGYVMFCVCVNGKMNAVTLHSAIAKAFVPNPDNKPMVNHIDGNKLNNSIDNLEWVTSRENTLHWVKSKRSIGYVFPYYPSKIKLDNREIFGYGSGYGLKPYFEGGVGTSCYYKILESIKGKFQKIASGKTYDVYTINF